MRAVFVIRFAGVAVACALLLGTNTPTAAGIPVPDGGHASCAPDEARVGHVVLFERGTSEHTAEAAITSACGSMLSYYPEIGVAVASAPEDDFAAQIGFDRAYSAGSATTAATGVGGGAEGGDGDSAWNMRAIGAAGRGSSPGSADVVVAVLDSGIDTHHPALRGAVTAELSASCLSGAPATSSRPSTAEKDTAEEDTAEDTAHGTHVAGIIASAPDESAVRGVAPGVRVASVRVIGDDGATTPRAVVCGLMWAARHGMAVANASFMLTTGDDCVADSGPPVVREAISRAVEYATSHGTVVVAAATNQARRLTPATASDAVAPSAQAPGMCRVLPASLPGVVTVSALTASGVKAGYSSYGLGVIDVTAPGGAPGQCVRSTVPGGYARMCGTSMAAAHTSGVLALLASTHPAYSTHQLVGALHRQADAKPCPADYDLDGDGRQDAYCTGYAGYNGFYGHGVVDADAATGTTDSVSAQ